MTDMETVLPATQVADKPETGQPRQFLGIRVSALLEVAVFLAIALAADTFSGAGNRFADVSPHPFWIVVLLASTYYGTNEGLAATVLCSAALLFGNLPEQGIDEDSYAWILRATWQPILWCIAAVVLGEVQVARRRERDALREEMARTRMQARGITDAYQQLSRVKESLETRVAGQLRTVYTMYTASQAIERQRIGEVLVGISDLVQTVMSPIKFSLFLLNGTTLEAASSEGWTTDDRFSRTFDASSRMFEAIVVGRKFLVVANRSHEMILQGEGLLAGPLVSAETGEIVGMLKIEEMGFLELHPSNVENFQLLCNWIGTAFANAQRFELRQFAPAGFDQQCVILRQLSCRLGFSVATVYLSVDLEKGAEPSTWISIARLVSKVADRVLRVTDMHFDYRHGGWHYAILLPGTAPEKASIVALKFEAELDRELSRAGFAASIHHRAESLR
jgi:hypothetical protein